MTDKKWGTVQEAQNYYEIGLTTLHNWRRENKIISKVDDSTNRFGYLYLLDPELKQQISIMKKFDKRWR